MISGQCVHVATVWNAIRVGDGLYEFLLAVYWRFWQGQLLPYAPQAKRALYANLATALFLRALWQVVDSTAGDVVQLVRNCHSVPAHCHGRPRSFFDDIPQQAQNPTLGPSVGTTPSQISKIAMMVGFWALIPDNVTYLANLTYFPPYTGLDAV